MSDLDKLMKKLKKEDKPVEETTKEELPETPKIEEEEEDFKDDGENLEENPTEEKKVDESKPIKVNSAPQHSIENEVGVLQNTGVFRRELLLTLKELVDVHKANTQTLIDLKNKFDEADGTKKE